MIGSFRLTQIGEFQPTRSGVFRPTQFGEFHPTRTAIEHSEDADALANHVRCESDAVVRMCGERVRKVACNSEVILRRGAGRTGKEDGVVKDGLLHDGHLLNV